MRLTTIGGGDNKIKYMTGGGIASEKGGGCAGESKRACFGLELGEKRP